MWCHHIHPRKAQTLYSFQSTMRKKRVMMIATVAGATLHTRAIDSWVKEKKRKEKERLPGTHTQWESTGTPSARWHRWVIPAEAAVDASRAMQTLKPTDTQRRLRFASNIINTSSKAHTMGRTTQILVHKTQWEWEFSSSLTHLLSLSLPIAHDRFMISRFRICSLSIVENTLRLIDRLRDAPFAGSKFVSVSVCGYARASNLYCFFFATAPSS